MRRVFFLTLIICGFVHGSGQSWQEQAKLVAENRENAAEYGSSVALYDTYLVVGADKENQYTSVGNILGTAGAVYIYNRDQSGNWNLFQELAASDKSAYARFGHSVSVNGDYLIVGANRENLNISGNNVGAAYIFEKGETGNWVEVQKLVASDRDDGDHFGISVSISGNYAIVGANREDDDALGGNFEKWAGSAYLFERTENGNWQQIQKMVAADRSEKDRFGTSVSIDGNFAVVGANQDGEDEAGGNILSRSGSAYIFTRDSAGDWQQLQKIVQSDRADTDYFGTSVSISGNTLIAGAYRKESAGVSYIFEHMAGNSWSETQKLVPSNSEEIGHFGEVVCIDGNKAIVGAKFSGEIISPNTFIREIGAAFIFEKTSTTPWQEVQRIQASDKAEFDWFGFSVAINDQYAAVGAIYEDEDVSGGATIDFAGSVYVFESSSALGIIPNSFTNQMLIYPNPTREKITIDLGKTYLDINLTVRNTLGQAVFTQFYETAYKIPLELKIIPGIYLIEVQTKAGDWARKKIIMK